MPTAPACCEINGSPTDAAAGLIRDGIHRGLKESAATRRLPNTTRRNGRRRRRQEWAAGQITRFGAEIKGVVAANDGTAGGAIAAFKAAGVKPVPPVTGNDATIAALQLIISGDQYNTISKPSEIVAAAAANVAVQLIKGETAGGQDDALQYAVAALHPGRRDGREHQGRNLRQEDPDARADLHRRICRRLQEARHHQLNALQ